MLHLRLIDLFFLLMVFEGAVRRFLVPALGTEIQVFRDLLPILALGIYLLSGRKSHHLAWPPPLTQMALILYILVASLQLWNPRLWNVEVGLLGLRTHFAYLPLLLMAPIYICSYDKLIVRLVSLCLIAFPVVALGLVQNQLPASHPLNADIVAGFGSEGLVRATGTFYYLTGYSVFCQFVVIAAVVLMVLRPMPSRVGLLAACAATFAFIGCLSSGSRGSVYGAAVQLALFSSILMWSRFRNRVVLRILMVAVIGIAAVAFVVTWVPHVYTAFFERTVTAGDDLQGRYVDAFTGWVSVLDLYPWGNGVGMGHQQAGVLAGYTAGFLSGYEAELDRIAYEVGIFGFFGFIVFRIGLLLRIGFGARQLNEPVGATLAALSFSTIALMSAGGIYTPMANALLMLMAGLGLTVVEGPRRSAYAAMRSRAHTERYLNPQRLAPTSTRIGLNSSRGAALGRATSSLGSSRRRM